MAAFVLRKPDVFPDGTEVGAYPKSNWPTPAPPSGSPIGEAAAEAEVEDGVAEFTGLDPNSEFWAVAEVAEGVYRYITISTSQGTDVTGARDEPEGALASLLTVLDEKGIVKDRTTKS